MPESFCRQALSQATGKSDAILKQQLKESGDLGIVATKARSTQRTMFKMSALTVPFVFKCVMHLAQFLDSTGLNACCSSAESATQGHHIEPRGGNLSLCAEHAGRHLASLLQLLNTPPALGMQQLR